MEGRKEWEKEEKKTDECPLNPNEKKGRNQPMKVRDKQANQLPVQYVNIMLHVGNYQKAKGKQIFLKIKYCLQPYALCVHNDSFFPLQLSEQHLTVGLLEIGIGGPQISGVNYLNIGGKIRPTKDYMKRRREN